MKTTPKVEKTNRKAYVMVCFPVSVLQQLRRSEYEEKLALLRVQKFSGVLLDQQDCLFVYWFLKHLVWNL